MKHVVDGSIGGSPNTACHEETHKVAGKGILELGSWTPRISRSGLLANACTRIAWWLNGDLMGNYGDDPVIDATNVDSEVLRRADHTLYELKSGDLIAFRYKTASYYCFNSQVILNVNGTVLDSATGAMSITFARQHTPDWFMPSFTPVFSPSESGATPTDFSPLRTNFLSSGLPITPGVDHWEAPDGSRDHALSNFYYRIQIP